MRKCWFYIMLMVMLGLASCSQRPLYCPDDTLWKVHVAFEWDLAPEANPDGMTVWFYNRDSGAAWRFDIAGRDGGDVELPIGRYTMITLNNDIAGADVTGQDKASTNTLVCRDQGGGVVRQPGLVYGTTLEDVEVTPCGITYTRDDGAGCKDCPYFLLRCHPQLRSVTYRIYVEDVKGVEWVRSCSARLDGVAGRLGLLLWQPQGSAVAVTGTLSVNAEMLAGKMTGLGLYGWSSTPYELTLRVVRTDGTVIERKFDVTNQVATAHDPYNVEIRLGGVEIPAPDSGGETPGEGDVEINVGVDGWNVVEIYL